MVRTERAAVPISDYAHLVATDTEHTGDVIAETEDALAADMQCKMPPRRVVFGKGGTRLDRVYDDSVAAQFESRDMSGAGKGFGDCRIVVRTATHGRAAVPENTTVACMIGQGQMRKIDRCIAKGKVAPIPAVRRTASQSR